MKTIQAYLYPIKLEVLQYIKNEVFFIFYTLCERNLKKKMWHKFTL